MNPIARLIAAPNRRRATDIAAHVLPYLQSGQRILDIGAGTCHVAEAIIRRGHDVTLVDVADGSLVPGLRAQLYDGRRLPFPDDAFDVVLLLTVLHHIPRPDDTLVEARRVARRIAIIEDVFESAAEKWLTWIGDSWLNREFFGHPHSNRTDQGWRETFERLDLRLVEARQQIHWFFPFRFRHAIYWLSRD
jgi:ubiquinone/menaquinone biosynthesis C-methylase UbiE